MNERNGFNPLKNLIVNLSASGVSAVVGLWILGVTAVGIFGSGDIAARSLSLLAYAGGSLLITLSLSSRK